MSSYKTVRIYHAVDNSTEFLDSLKKFDKYYFPFNEENYQTFIDDMKNQDEKSLFIFAGHGYSDGLYRPSNNRDPEVDYRMLDPTHANICFQDHDVLLLSCRSEQFIKKLSGYNSIIGFGNIISSKMELEQANENSDSKIVLDENDIDIFNSSFLEAISSSLDLLIKEKVIFSKLNIWIEYFINKAISRILTDKTILNRKEISKQLFRFRNEMRILRGF